MRFDGRINRVQFFTTTLISQFWVWAPGMVVFIGVWLVGSALRLPASGLSEAGVVVLLLAASFVAVAAPISRRSHDLGWPAMPVLILFAMSAVVITTGTALMVFGADFSGLVVTVCKTIAAPGYAAFLLLLVLPGQPTANRFGPSVKNAT